MTIVVANDSMKATTFVEKMAVTRLAKTPF
jgi:hypothetical protein